jgi:putative transcriptional regulator
MSELREIIEKGRSPAGDGQFNMRTAEVEEPGIHTAASIRKLRTRLGLSQPAFASMIGVSTVLVRFWERGARAPSPLASRLLDQVQHHPQHFFSLIKSAKQRDLVPPVRGHRLAS